MSSLAVSAYVARFETAAVVTDEVEAYEVKASCRRSGSSASSVMLMPVAGMWAVVASREASGVARAGVRLGRRRRLVQRVLVEGLMLGKRRGNDNKLLTWAGQATCYLTGSLDVVVACTATGGKIYE